MIIRASRVAKKRKDRCALRSKFFNDCERYHIDFWKLDPRSASVGNDLSPRSPPTETPGKFCSFAVSSSRSPLPRPKAFPNTEQLSSNCVSRLARSLDPSATVIPLQALGPGAFCIHTYVHARGAARNPGIPCRGGLLRQDPLDRTHPIHPCAESNGPRPDFLSEAIQRFGLRAELGARESESYRFEYPVYKV